MLRTATILLVTALALAFGACGSGGGGDAPSAPGTLRALAVQGQPAPGTSGDYAAFPPHPLMSAANGGYCAFVAPTTDMTAAEVVYVAQPDDVPTIVRVFAVGDVLPAPSDGTIAGFGGVWMCDDGTVIAYVTIAGDSGSRGYGILSATVSGGSVSNLAAAIYDLQDLTGAGGAAALTHIEVETLCKANDGTIWFFGTDGAAGPVELWSVAKDGSDLTRRAGLGFAFVDQNMQPAGVATSIDAFGLSDDGSIFCFVAGKSTGGRTMVVKTSAGGALNQEFFRTGDSLPTGGTVTNVHKDGRIIVYRTGEVAWVAQGNAGGTDDVLMLYDPSPVGYFALARSGDTAPGAGMGTLNAIDLLQTAKSCGFPVFHCTVTGSTSGITQATYVVLGIGAGNLLGYASNLVLSGNAFVPASWIDLGRVAPGLDEVAANGSHLFVQAWSGTSAVFWALGDLGTFALAAEGGPAPDGDTFGAFEPTSAHAVANGNALFRADLVTNGSGIFRRGP